MKKGMSVWKGMSGKKKTAVAIVSLAGICILGTGVFWARNKMSKGKPVECFGAGGVGSFR